MTNLPAIRSALAELPPSDYTDSGTVIEAEDILVPPVHANALSPSRTVVLGNRGMGKSFWTRVLSDEDLRPKYERYLRGPKGMTWKTRVGFDESPHFQLWLERASEQQPEPVLLWRARLGQVLSEPADEPPVKRALDWLERAKDPVWLDTILRRFEHRPEGLVVVFDALDRLGTDWREAQARTRGLLQVALFARSTRNLRFKLFMRTDQFDDPDLFQFTDASKLKNDRVELGWRPEELYSLLFNRLRREAEFEGLRAKLRNDQEAIIDALAGRYMGANRRRGRVYTWVPKHLADARDETSPRTFLTAWGEAARHQPPPEGRVVDHHGIHQGVRKASEFRLAELREDYGWVIPALDALRDTSVPMSRDDLFRSWQQKEALKAIQERGSGTRNAPVRFDDRDPVRPQQLLSALVSVGVLEERLNRKINVPDIFRVQAGIKRRGGVKPPLRRSK